MTYRQFLLWVKRNVGILENLRSGKAADSVEVLLMSGQIEFQSPLERRVFQLAHAASVGPVRGRLRVIGSSEVITRDEAIEELERIEEGQSIRRYKAIALSRLVGDPEIKGLVSGIEMLVE